MAYQQMISATASSSIPSSSAKSLKKYDVFLSFRGEDTRSNFTSHLYDALREKVETYIDNELERGEEISKKLMKAIEESHASIIIFSENYASSKWCLDELSKILECKKDQGQVVIPVFYKIDPSNVRKQTGSYKQAFAKHERDLRRNKGKVHKWKAALTEAASLAGLDFQNYRTEVEFIKDIIKVVLEKLNLRYAIEFKGLVGIEENYAKIESLLEIAPTEVRIIGIWGMGGIGKTTLAKALYAKAKLSSLFHGHCFLEKVREESAKKGPNALRKKLFSDLLNKESLNLDALGVESNFVMARLRRKKVFIVLDDVATSKQLEDLILDYDCFGLGSRIIVTTRNKHVFSQVHEIYEVKKLNVNDSRQLFCENASTEMHPKNGYEELLQGVIAYCKGIPLALKVLGARLRRRSKEAWESELRKLEKIPDVEIHEVLRLSYDDLDRIQQDIFLDIACFFKGESIDHVTSLLKACNFFPASGLEVLLDMALITISYTNTIEMHDLIQEMGWEIVHQESSKDPGRRSRLWNPEEVCDVLKYNRGTEAVEGIILDVSKIEDLRLSSDCFAKMTNLRFLKFYSRDSSGRCNVYFPNSLGSLSDKLRYLSWPGYCLEPLPSICCVKMLVELHIFDSNLEKLWDGVQDFVNLKTISLRRCKNLVEVPDLSIAANLNAVFLEHCKSLCQVHPSIFSLPKLTYLSLVRCNLQAHPYNIGLLSSLERLDLSGNNVERLSASIKNLSMLKVLLLDDCKKLVFVPELPPSLQRLSADNCTSLEKVFNLNSVEIVDGLRSLRSLRLSNCCNLQILPDSIGLLSSLETLDLRGNNVERLSASIKNLSMLKVLRLDDCKKLVFVPELPPSLQRLSADNCTSLEKVFNLNSVEIVDGLRSLRSLLLSNCCNLQILPDSIGLLSSLEILNLRGNSVERLSASIKNLSMLKVLRLDDCKKLVFVPELPPSLQELSADNCTSLEKVFNLISVEIIDGLRSLRWLGLSNWCNLQILPDSIGLLSSLVTLDLRGNNVERLSASIKNLSMLKVLRLDDCKKLVFVPELPPSLQELSANNCTSLEKVFNLNSVEIVDGLWSLRWLSLSNCCNLQILPDSIGLLSSLETLNLSGNNVERLSASIKNLSMLKMLLLDDCKKLVFVPELPPSLQLLSADNCTSLEKVFNLISVEIVDGLRSLRSLRLSNCCNLQILPDSIGLLSSLEILNLRGNSVERLSASIKNLSMLKVLRLDDCKKLVFVPELPPSLQRLSADNCTSLEKVFNLNSVEIVDGLGSLRSLRLSNCCNLQILPDSIGLLSSLETLDLRGNNVERLSASIKNLSMLKVLRLDDCKKLVFVPELPPSLQRLSADNCTSLEKVFNLNSVEIVDGLRSLRSLRLSNCCNLQILPDSIGLLSSLETLDLRGNNVERLSASIKNLSMLKVLRLDDCKKLVFVPELPPSLQELSADNCTSLEKVFNLISVEIVDGLRSLRSLRLSNCCNLQILPDSIGLLSSLEILNLRGNSVERLSASIKNLSMLKVLRLDDCKKLVFVPELPPSLQRLSADNCTSLEKVFNLNSVEIVDGLGSLRSLRLSNCCNLQILPDSIGLLSSLETLDLRGNNVERLSASIKNLSMLKVLRLDDCKKLVFVPELPPSLQRLSADNCTSLEKVFNLNSVEIVDGLRSLRSLRLSNCCNLQILPDSIGLLSSLETLDLRGNNVERLSASIKNLSMLKVLRLDDCKKLVFVPELPPSLQEVSADNCTSLEKVFNLISVEIVDGLRSLRSLRLSNCCNLQILPDSIGLLSSLETLDLRGNNVERLSASIKNLSMLKVLRLDDCKKLVFVPELPPSLQELSADNCTSLEKVFNLISVEIVDGLRSLRWLSLSNCCNLQILPDSIGLLSSLEILNLRGNSVERLSASIKNLSMLKVLRLDDCKKLVFVPELPPSLQRLSADNCTSLEKVFNLNSVEIVDGLRSFRSLRLSNCCNLQILPDSIGLLSSLETLDLRGNNVERLSASIKNLSMLKVLRLDDCKKLVFVPELPPSLQRLSADNCTSLEKVFNLISVEIVDGLRSLRSLRLSNCCNLQILPDSIGLLSSLETLDLRGNNVERLSASIKNLSMLKVLRLDDCKKLVFVPELPPSLQRLSADNCTSLEKVFNLISVEIVDGLRSLRSLRLSNCCNLQILPDSIGLLSSLETLDLRGNNVERLSASIKNLSMLKVLRLDDCKKLVFVPELPPSLQELSADNCTSLEKVFNLICVEIVDALRSLKWLSLSNCCNLQILPDSIGLLSLLEILNLRGNSVERLSASIKNLSMLKVLRLDGCKKLVFVPELPPSLQRLSADNCTSLEKVFNLNSVEIVDGLRSLRSLRLSNCCNLQILPDSIGLLLSLETLDLRGNNVERLSASIKNLSMLKVLRLDDCKKLVLVPELPPSLQRLSAVNCTSLDIDITQRLVLEHKLQNIYAHDDDDDQGHVLLPGAQVPDLFCLRTAETSITIPYLPQSDLRGFIFCIILSESISCGELLDALCFLNGHDKVKTSISFGDNENFISDHVLLWYADFKYLHKIQKSGANDYYNNISFEFKIGCELSGNMSGERIKGCGVKPIYASELELLLGGSTKDIVELEPKAQSSSNAQSSHKQEPLPWTNNLEKYIFQPDFDELLPRAIGVEVGGSNRENEDDQTKKLQEVMHQTITIGTQMQNEIGDLNEKYSCGCFIGLMLKHLWGLISNDEPGESKH